MTEEPFSEVAVKELKKAAGEREITTTAYLQDFNTSGINEINFMKDNSSDRIVSILHYQEA